MAWDQRQLEQFLYDTIAREPFEEENYWAPKWAEPETEAELWAQLRTPGDLLVWLVALRERYQGQYIQPEQWATLAAAMDEARKRRTHTTDDWQQEDWLLAKQALGR